MVVKLEIILKNREVRMQKIGSFGVKSLISRFKRSDLFDENLKLLQRKD